MEFDRPGFDREVGLRLQLARKRRGITQAQLAEKIGLPRPSYANLESGRQRIPIDVVWRVAVALGVSIATLVPEPVNRRAAAGESLFPPVDGLFGENRMADNRANYATPTGVVTSTSTAYMNYNPIEVPDLDPIAFGVPLNLVVAKAKITE